MKGFDFAQETMDYRLFWLKFAKRIWMVFVATILGALLVGINGVKMVRNAPQASEPLKIRRNWNYEIRHCRSP